MNCKEAVRLLDSILDCQATEAEQKKFFKHMDKCAPCFDHYELERLFVEFVKKNEGKCGCPSDLVDQIRNQITELK